MRGLLKTRQGAAAGSVYVAGAFAISGVLTFVFHGYTGRSLGPARYGDFGVLWTSVFLVAQLLWIGVSQTLGRYVAEREARGEDPRPVISSVRRLSLALLGTFLLVSLLASPLISSAVFEGDWLLTIAFIAAVAAYAPEYFLRGIFGGHRQFARLGTLHVAESSSRMLLAVVLLFAGVGIAGPAAAVVLAPLVGALAVWPGAADSSGEEGEPFSAIGAFRFAGPVLLCVTFGQTLMNGGPILVRLLGGTSTQVALLVTALILARTPQYVLSPVIASLLPHASRALATEGRRGFNRFVLRAVAVVGSVGILMVGGTWLLGEWALRLVYGSRFEVGTGLLVTLAALAAFYLLSEMFSQVLFALGRARLAAVGWFAGLPVSAVAMALLQTGVVERVAYSIALGAFAAALVQAAFYVATRRSTPDAP